MKGCLFALGVLVVIVVVAAGALMFLNWQSSPVRQLQQVEVSSEAAKSFDQKVGEVNNAVATAEVSKTPVPVTVRITEQEITSKVAEALQQSPDVTGLNPRDVQVHLVPGKIVTTATITVSGFDVPATITALVGMQNGVPKVTVESVQVSGIPVPGGLQDQLAQAIDEQLTPLLTNLPIQVQDIRVEQGAIVVSGVTKAQ